ncbi:MAG: hypothetical protein AB8G16_18445 [Gammaproteobacteria bacterium]
MHSGHYKTKLIHCAAAAAFLLVMAAPSGHAVSPTSTNYAIPWDTIDGGGGTAMSASYTLQDSAAQPSPMGDSVSASYRVQPGFYSVPDTDSDTVRDFMDNCTQDANEDQRDTNGDGFGNRCDADLNDDGVTNAVDLGLLRLRFFTSDPDADLNGDGVVNVLDLGIIRLRFFTAPGPSGIAP